jgi:hypothetical protein
MNTEMDNTEKSGKEVVAWLHDGLDSAEKAAFAERLRHDPELHTLLSQERQKLQRIQAALVARLESEPVPASLTFDTIAPDLQRRRPAAPVMRWFSAFVVLGAILMITGALLLSLAGPDPLTGSSPTLTVTVTAPALQPVLPPGENPQPAPSPTATLTPVAEDGNSSGSSLPTRTPQPP